MNFNLFAKIMRFFEQTKYLNEKTHFLCKKNVFYLLRLSIIVGRKVEMISTTMPAINTLIVLLEQPFHSLRMMPQTFENTTLSAMRMQNDRIFFLMIRRPP